MDAYDLERDEQGRDWVRLSLRGRELLTHNMYNRGTAFTPSERSALGISGLLPSAFSTMEEQVRRAQRRKQELDHTVRLLLDDAHQGPVTVEQEREVEPRRA